MRVRIDHYPDEGRAVDALAELVKADLSAKSGEGILWGQPTTLCICYQGFEAGLASAAMVFPPTSALEAEFSRSAKKERITLSVDANLSCTHPARAT